MIYVKCTLNSVHSTQYTVHFTVYNVQCTVYSTVYSVQYTVYSVQCRPGAVAGSGLTWVSHPTRWLPWGWTVYSVLYSVQCIVYTVYTVFKFILVLTLYIEKGNPLETRAFKYPNSYYGYCMFKI